MTNTLNSRVKYYPVNNRRYEVFDVCGSSVEEAADYYFELLPHGAKDALKVYRRANRRSYEVASLELAEFSDRKVRRHSNASRDPREAVVYEIDGGWLSHQLGCLINQVAMYYIYENRFSNSQRLSGYSVATEKEHDSMPESVQYHYGGPLTEEEIKEREAELQAELDQEWGRFDPDAAFEDQPIP